jgi:hypothetical protein
VVLGRLKSKQQSHLYQRSVPLRLRSLLESLKGMSPGSNQIPAELIQVGEGHCILRYIDLLC